MIHDISQPVFGCCVYPGDSRPEKRPVSSIDEGAPCNLTDISMCVHNGTHVDAPLHFFRDGRGIGRIALEKFIGPAFVAHHEGDLTARDAAALLSRAASLSAEASRKILIGGNATVTPGAAEVFAEAGIDLIGNESQSVGPLNAPMAVHRILLGAEIVLLEGIRLSAVPEGVYFLNCAPLDLSDTDGAPCRAVLIDIPETGIGAVR